MADRTIIFSAPMVGALLAGRKTQTRRLLPRQPACPESIPANATWAPDYGFKPDRLAGQTWSLHSPYLGTTRLLHAASKVRFAVGDRLWVREGFSGEYAYKIAPPREWRRLGNQGIWYWADGDPIDGDWTKPKPSIHMPRWASRLTLTVTDVRVQRLQEISEADARAEGHPFTWDGKQYEPPPLDSWQGYGSASFFLSVGKEFGPGAWVANPSVVAITFTVDRRNIDQEPTP